MVAIRNKILSYLTAHPQGSVPELSTSLQVTQADVRYHLKALVHSGQLERKPLCPVTQKGRPRFLYSLSGASLPDNYQGLARAIMAIASMAVSGDPGAPGAEILDPDLLANEIIHSTDHVKSGPKKLAELVKRLNQLGYHAHWEAYSQGPRIIFRNCPYATLAAHFPILCQMDRRILESFLDSSFSQTAKTSQAGGTARQCIFKTNVP